MDGVTRTVTKVETVRAENHVVADQKSGDVHGIQYGNGEFGGTSDQGALQFQPGVVTGERGAAVGVGAEEALRDAAVAFARERHAPPFQIGDRLRGVFGDGLHRDRVGEQIALGDGVGGVLLPAVLGVHRGQCGVDPARGERGVRVGLGPLADHQHIDSVFGQFDRGAQPRTAGADDEHCGGDLPGGVFGSHLRENAGVTIELSGR